jgi:hypothetical protein
MRLSMLDPAVSNVQQLRIDHGTIEAASLTSSSRPQSNPYVLPV